MPSKDQQQGDLQPPAVRAGVQLFDHDRLDRDRPRARRAEELPSRVAAADVRWREGRCERGDRDGADVRGLHPGRDVLRVRALLGRFDFDPLERGAHGRRVGVSAVWTSCHRAPDHIGQTGHVVKPLVGLPSRPGANRSPCGGAAPRGIQVDRGVEGSSAEELRRHVGHGVLARAGVRRVGASFRVGAEQGAIPMPITRAPSRPSRSRVTMMFCGVRSPCTRPWACPAPRASSTSVASRSTVEGAQRAIAQDV